MAVEARQPFLETAPSLCNGHLHRHHQDLAHRLASQMDRHRQEIDQLLRLHSLRLRSALQRQMREQVLLLARRMDLKAAALLKQKDDDLASANKKTMELEACLKRAEEEGHAWRRIAEENEAMAAALQNQVRMTAIAAPDDDGDAASCCDSNGGDLIKGKAVPGRCRGCGCRDSCVLFVPCMHLCSCELCDLLFDSCPVCSSAKQGSIQVFFS
ncbi:SBP (S-ribonuclease binding protein) family protein [Wolffia australiana]